MFVEGAAPMQSKTSAQVYIRDEANPPAGMRWYVVQTQTHGENRAIANLERQGYRVFCPRVAKMVRHARKSRRVLAALFPNYLFIQLDITREPWRSINGTFGVVRVITQAETPRPVLPGVVEELQARVCADGAVDWSRSFKVGQSVRIADGPFAELVGTLEQLDASGRVRVLLDLLGRPVLVALRCGALAPAA